MKKGTVMTAMMAVAFLTAVAMVGTAATISEPVFVNTFPDHNRCWSTVFINEVSLQWDWPINAVSAQLTIIGMNGSVVMDFETVTTAYTWRVSASDVPSVEDVYTLTLTFYGNEEAVVDALTAQLAVVKGAFGAARVDCETASKGWSKVKDNVVIPYDAGWDPATAGATHGSLVIAKQGGSVQTNSLARAAGYFGWKIKGGDWGYGDFDLALTFPGSVTNEWTAMLTRPMDGSIIMVR